MILDNRVLIVLILRHNSIIIEEVKKEYELKGVGTPQYYLGGDVEMMEDQTSTKDVMGIDEAGNDINNQSISVEWLKEGIKTAFSAKTYIQNTTKRLEEMIGKEFPKFDTPMSETSHPELDDSPLLNSIEHSKFRSIVGCANWLITLGRFDIAIASDTVHLRHNKAFLNTRRSGYMRE